MTKKIKLDVKYTKSIRESVQMTNKPLSNCCHASMKVEGHTTHYYVCLKCNKPCDQAGDNKCEDTIHHGKES